jgi:hypothetical protein
VSVELAVFWGDTHQLLTPTERRELLHTANLESLSKHEVLLREPKTKRLIVVTSAKKEQVLFCSLCKNELVRKRYGQSCPGFARCCLEQKHKGEKEIKP